MWQKTLMFPKEKWRVNQTQIQGSIDDSKTRTFSRIFHSYKTYPLALLGLLTGRNDRFSYPFMYFTFWRPNPFITPEAWKSYPFLAEPPRMGHYRECPLPGLQYFIPGAFTFPSSSVPVIHSWCLYFGVIWKRAVFLSTTHLWQIIQRPYKG